MALWRLQGCRWSGYRRSERWLPPRLLLLKSWPMRGRVWMLALLPLLLGTPVLPQCSFTPVYSGAFRAAALDLSVDGSDLWVATSYGLQLYDRTVDPPSLVAAIPLSGVTAVVRASGGTAYVGSGSS